ESEVEPRQPQPSQQSHSKQKDLSPLEGLMKGAPRSSGRRSRSTEHRSRNRGEKNEIESAEPKLRKLQEIVADLILRRDFKIVSDYIPIDDLLPEVDYFDRQVAVLEANGLLQPLLYLDDQDPVEFSQRKIPVVVKLPDLTDIRASFRTLLHMI